MNRTTIRHPYVSHRIFCFLIALLSRLIGAYYNLVQQLQNPLLAACLSFLRPSPRPGMGYLHRHGQCPRLCRSVHRSSGLKSGMAADGAAVRLMPLTGRRSAAKKLHPAQAIGSRVREVVGHQKCIDLHPSRGKAEDLRVIMIHCTAWNRYGNVEDCIR